MNRKQKIEILQGIENGTKKVADLLPQPEICLSMATTEELHFIKGLFEKYNSRSLSLADLNDEDGRKYWAILTRCRKSHQTAN